MMYVRVICRCSISALVGNCMNLTLLSLTKTNWLILFGEMVSVHREN